MHLSLSLALGGQRSSGGASGGAPPGSLTRVTDTLLADGTWTSPASITGVDGVTANRAQIECWAPGAGGTLAVSGGGGGAYARGNAVVVAPSTGYAVAGLAGAAVNVNATDATFDTTVVVAKGGLSGTNGGAGGTAAASTGDTKFSGGNGTAGAGSVAGGGGAGEAAAGVLGIGGANTGGTSNANADGRMLGAAGGSSAGSGRAGARGEFRATYYAPATVGFPRVDQETFGRDAANGTTRNITLPSGSGGRLMCVVCSDGVPTISMSGWTQVGTQTNGAGSTHAIAVFRRDSDGSDGSNIAIATSATERVAWYVVRLQNAGSGIELTGTALSSTNADCPNHTPSGGSAKYLWFAVVGWDAIALTMSAFPANYGSGLTLHDDGSAQGVMLITTRRYLEAASENPGAFTSSAQSWVGVTISVPPG